MAEGKAGYGKKSLWKWILIYLVIGGIVYFLVYHFFLAGTAGYNSGSSNNQGSSYNQGGSTNNQGTSNNQNPSYPNYK